MLCGAVARPNAGVRTKVTDAIVSVTCKGAHVSSLYNCVKDGVICSNEGNCSDGECRCNPTRTGQYCQQNVSSSDLSDGAIAGIVVGVVVPCLLLIILAVVAVVILMSCRKKKVNSPVLFIGTTVSELSFILPGLLIQTEDWIIDPSELELGEALGSGGFGEVRKAVWRGTEVAVKTMSSSYSNELKNAFIEEVSVMTALRHPNVVLFMAAATKPPAMCIGTASSPFPHLLDVLTRFTVLCVCVRFQSWS